MEYLRERQEGGYRAVDPDVFPSDNYERVYLAHPDVSADKHNYDKFEVRTPHNSHMSTVMYIERTMEFEFEYYNNSNFFPLDVSDKTVALDSCGFSLQNNMRTMTMDYEFSTVVEKPSEWVPIYTHMYPKSLAPMARNSGRNFGENHDAGMNFVYNNRGIREVKLVPGVNLFTNEEVDRRKLHAALDRELLAIPNQEVYTFTPNEPARAADAYQPRPPDNYVTAAAGVDRIADNDGYAGMTAQITALEESKTDVWDVIAKHNEGAEDLTDEETDVIVAFDHICKQLVKIADSSFYKEPLTTIQAIFATARLPALFTVPGDASQIRMFLIHAPNDTYIQSYTNLNEAADIARNIYLVRHPFDPDKHTNRHPRYFPTLYYSNDGTAIANGDMRITEDLGNMTDVQLRTAFNHAYTKLQIVRLYKIARRIGLHQNELTAEQVVHAQHVLGHPNPFLMDAYTIPAGILEEWKNIYRNYMYPLYNYVATTEHYVDFNTITDLDTNQVLTTRGVVFRDGHPTPIPMYTRFRHTFIEPVVCGLGKPSPGCRVGCWKNVGEVIPRIDRFSLQAHYEDKLNNRLFDVYALRAFVSNSTRSVFSRKVSAKLHTVHYRHILKPRVSLVQHCFEKHHLVRHFMFGGVDGGASRTFEFEFSFRTNSEPIFIWFYTQRSDRDVHMYNDVPKLHLRGPAITQFLLHNKTRSKVLDYTSGDHRARLLQLTQDVFPEYCPPRSHYGGYVCLPYCSIPKSVHVSGFEEELSGRITAKSTAGDYHMQQPEGLEFDLCALVMYKDKYLSVNQNDIRRGFDV